MGSDKVPTGFPQPKPTVSYWQLPAHPTANYRTSPSLPTSSTVDYVIIGSGVSGAAIAYKLLSRDPSLSVLVLEARSAASGASGRSGGHCRANWWMKFSKHVAAFGEEEAIKFEQLERQNILDIANFAKNHAVDCDFQDVETADAYTTTEAWERVLESLLQREEAMKRRSEVDPLSEVRIWHGHGASEHLGLPNILGAVTYPAHTMNPYLFVCKLLELSLEKGLNLQTNTPALAVTPISAGDDSTAKWAIQTDRGTIRAKQVILATNAYTNVLHRSLADTGFLMPWRSQITAIKPQGDLSNHPALRMSVVVSDRGSGHYFMIRAPGLRGGGDVLYGGSQGIFRDRQRGITDDSTINNEIAAYLKHSAPEVIGRESWGEQSEEISDWTGVTCFTPDPFPLVGEVPGEDGLWASVGMNGHGMAMAFRSAEALVVMMTTGKEPYWFPRSFRIGRAWAKGAYGN